jgi:ribonuclease HI
MEPKYNVTITTDGSCLGNPGPGGYAAILRCGDKVKEVAGYEPESTNNRMELLAVLQAVLLLKTPCNITIRSDATYFLDNFKRLDQFEASGWKTKTGKTIASAALWKQLNALRKKHKFQLVKVAAHSGDPDNERCDALAKKQIRENFILFQEVE